MSWLRHLILALAAVAAGAAVAGTSQRSALVAAGSAGLSCLLLAALNARSGPDGHPLRRAWSLLAPLAASGAVLLALLAGSELYAASAAAIAVCLAGALSAELLAWLGRPLAKTSARLDGVLSLVGRRVQQNTVSDVPLDELRPGEEFVVERGDRVPADATVIAGSASVEPWLDCEERVKRQEGDALFAGALVVEGALRAVVRWSGDDRAWARLTRDPKQRADRHLAPARVAERLATRGAALAGVAAALVALAGDRPLSTVLSFAAAATAALANVGLPELLRQCIARRVYRLLSRGVAFRTPKALDRAGQIGSAVFCARGTLLSDELTLAQVEPVGRMDDKGLLALTAGAYRTFASAESSALNRSTLRHSIMADRVRSPVHHEGLGVTAVAANGQALMVGSRGLALRQHVSVASAEARINELEDLGRSVLLTALEGRLIGITALQDALRPGARGAVQDLLDAGIEPIVMSSSSQATSLALAQCLGVQHVRPEVLHSEQGLEVKRLQASGVSVAVIGRSPVDEAALAQAEVSIVMGGSGAGERWDIDVASGKVRDAAFALAIARELRRNATQSILCIAGPSGLLLLLLVFGMPAWPLPLAGFAGLCVAARRLA